MDSIENRDNCTSINSKYYLLDATLRERHERAVPQNDAYYFFPKGELIIKLNEKKPSRALRRIFKLEFGEYNAFELDQLVRLHQLMETHQEHSGIDFPKDWTEADNLRYLYSTNCNIPQALKDMIDHFNWRKETFPITPSSKEIEILNLGFIYIHGRDKDSRPIIVCQAIVFIQHEKDFTRDEWLRASCFLCEYAEKELLLPGHVETWDMVTNVRRANVLFLPSIMKHVIQVMSNNYRARLHANFIIGMSAAMRFLYKLICTFIDEVTVTKLKIIDDVNDGIMSQLIRPDNFEVKFGGKSRDLEQGKDLFFPPHMPSEHFMLDSEDRKEKLISEAEYEALYLKGSLNVISPLFLQKHKQKQKEKEETQEKEAKEALLKIMLQEKEEKSKETKRHSDNFNTELRSFNAESSEDTKLSKSSFRKVVYLPSDEAESLTSREVEAFNIRKKALNLTTPLFPQGTLINSICHNKGLKL